MKKLLFITTILLFAFSCKKERLNGSKEMLVGTWELEYVVKYYKDYKYNIIDRFDTLIPGKNTLGAIITIKKNGKVILEYNGTESEYKINFKEKYNSLAFFVNDLKFTNILTENGDVYLADVCGFYANLHPKDKDNVMLIEGGVNDNILNLNMGENIFSEKPNTSAEVH